VAFDATIFPILIAGPSDVTDELDAAVLAVTTWNDGHAGAMGLMMEPRSWRTHSAPELGEDAQAILNRQLGDQCDAVLAIFGTRMGTPTPRAISGTAEEIDRFVAAGKRVMVYFSTGPIPREGFSPEQYQALEDFKRAMRQRGLLGEYASTDDLRRQLDRHLVQLGNQFQDALNRDESRPRLSPTRSALNLEIVANLRTLQLLWDEIHRSRNLTGAHETRAARPELLPAVRLVRRDPPRWRRSVFEEQLPTIVQALTEDELMAVDAFYDRLAQFDARRGALKPNMFMSMADSFNFEPPGLEAWDEIQRVAEVLLRVGNPLEIEGQTGAESPSANNPNNPKLRAHETENRP
jgi:hypothetical protein